MFSIFVALFPVFPSPIDNDKRMSRYIQATILLKISCKLIFMKTSPTCGVGSFVAQSINK